MSKFANWKSYPFSVDGVEFVSFIDPNGDMYKQIQKVPLPIFNQMNEHAIRELIGNVSNMSHAEINDELEVVNIGYSQAYLALA